MSQERATLDRLRNENNYLLARCVDLETRLITILEKLHPLLDELAKKLKPVNVPRMLAVKDVAQLFNVAERTVNGWIQDRRIPSHKIGGVIRLSLDEILQCSKQDDDKNSSTVIPLPRSKRLQLRKD